MMEFEPIFIAYGALIAMALVPIIIGSYLAVEEDKTATDEERLSGSDAYWFPVMGSLVLFSLYLVFKYLPKEYINYALTGYFALFGTVSLVQLAVRFLQGFIPKPLELAGHFHILIQRGQTTNSLLDFNVTWLNVLVTLAASAFTGYYVWSKHWVASNIFGEAFSVSAISMIHLDSFTTGIILLSGLFVYDIFWVFGTDVMVTVAKNLDIPIKLLFPRDINTADSAFSMLGLGDIVLPGVFLALCLKFDKHLNSNGFNWYFNVGLVAYLAGLLSTMAVMHTFKAAQPALLYLSPACILASCGTALLRGQLKEFFAFETSAKGAPAKSPKKRTKAD